MKYKLRHLAYLYIVCGTVSLIFSWITMLEKLAFSVDVNHDAICNIDSVIHCGTVMSSPQAAIFGFPNPFIGLIGFAVVIVIGFAVLAGAKFKKWFWQGAQIGMTFAMIFVYWLYYEAVFEISALCIYCIIVWFATIPLFWYTTLYNLKERNIPLRGVSTQFSRRLSGIILSLMYLVIIIPIIYRFWDHWAYLLGLS
jgi:uncharacterized membrane protein